MKQSILCCILLLNSLITFGQADVSDDVVFSSIEYEAPLTIDLEGDEEEMLTEAPKKKKPKKNFYYGRKVRKGFTRSGYGDKAELYTFNYLKVYEEPVPYVRDVYWYDFKKKTITKSRKFNKDNAGILHGPYKRIKNDVILEEGIYYMGVKHGRWMRWNRHDILMEKEKYYKGWPKQSKVAYHNKEKKQLMEVIPVQHGEKEGYYYAFHKSGNLAAVGEFQFDKRVGIWKEYYDLKNRRKREIQYAKTAFDDEFVPYIVREWDERGKLIYENKK